MKMLVGQNSHMTQTLKLISLLDTLFMGLLRAECARFAPTPARTHVLGNMTCNIECVYFV